MNTTVRRMASLVAAASLLAGLLGAMGVAVTPRLALAHHAPDAG